MRFVVVFCSKLVRLQWRKLRLVKKKFLVCVSVYINVSA